MGKFPTDVAACRSLSLLEEPQGNHNSEDDSLICTATIKTDLEVEEVPESVKLDLATIENPRVVVE